MLSIQIFYALSFVIFTFFSVFWKNTDWPNILIKLAMLFMSIESALFFINPCQHIRNN